MPGLDTYTKLLLHMDTNFADSSSNNYTPTLINTPTIDNTNKKFGAGSGLFTQASSQAVTYPDSADWVLGTGDFTIDCWVRLAATATAYTVISQTVDDNNKLRLIISDTSLQFQVTSAASDLANYTAAVGSMGTASFHHIAIVRSGTNLIIFLDGANTSATAVTAISTNSLPDFARALEIGGNGGGTPFYMGGNIEEMRWSKGIARWTSNFTPPTGAYSRGGGLTAKSFYWGA